MMEQHYDPSPFMPIEPAARRLGVPMSWLRRELLEGRLPCLRAGGRIVVSVPQLLHALEQRAVGAIAQDGGLKRDTVKGFEP